MKFFKLFLLAALSATILIGCERQFVSPIDPTNPSQTASHLAQKALLDLADTAAEKSFVELANAAKNLAEALAADDGTSVEPLFSHVVKLADKATAMEQAFSNSECETHFTKLAKSSVYAVKAYTLRDADEMEQALQDLAQVVVTTEKVIRNLFYDSALMPLAFGYGSGIDSFSPYYMEGVYSDFPTPFSVDLNYGIGVAYIGYDMAIRPIPETRAAVNEFLTQKGYTVSFTDMINFGAQVDPILLAGELTNIPGVAYVIPVVPHKPQYAIPPPPSVEIIKRVAARYNEAWCQGEFGTIDNIIIEESGLDFFNYAFVRNLANIYAEEIPEATEQIRMNRFSLRSIAIKYLEIYMRESDKKTHDEIIELFRQSIRTVNLTIEHRTFIYYYLTTDYWKELVKAHINQ